MPLFSLFYCQRLLTKKCTAAGFLKTLHGDTSYATLSKSLGIAASTLYRLLHGEQSATLRGVENVLQKLGLSPADVFGEAIHRKRGRRG